MAPRKDHPVKVLESVVKRRYDCLQKLNGGSKKIRVK